MNDTITIYYYTAWDGFSWQGCDDATAKSLQGYMEATKTLPKSTVDVPPFGGAVPCKIAGRIGVAVYRYHTRLNGDLSGRDSLYIALAFVPLDTGCVDFARLLDLPQLAAPQSGELHPEDISVSGAELRLSDPSSIPEKWLDGDIEGTEYRVLKGRDGLLVLSRLFFSEYTQLGFLNAVFKSESDIDGLVATQNYSVYKEVKNVASAVESLRRAKGLGNGVLAADNPAVVKMKSALGELDKWASKQPGYPGLRKYYEVMRLELSDDAERLAAIRRFRERLDFMVGDVRSIEESIDRNWQARVFSQVLNSSDGFKVKRCATLAQEVLSLHVLDNPLYGDALKLALEAVRSSAYIFGMQRGAEFAQNVERERRSLEGELSRSRAEADRKSQGIRSLEDQLAKKDKQLKNKEIEIERLNSKLNSKKSDVNLPRLGASVQASRPRGGWWQSWFPGGRLGWLDWVFMALSAVFLGVIVILFFKMLPYRWFKGTGRQEKSPIQVETETNKLIYANTPHAESTNIVDQAGGCTNKSSACRQETAVKKTQKPIDDKKTFKKERDSNKEIKK